MPSKETINLNDAWEFTRGKQSTYWLNDGDAIVPNAMLPHCWNEEDAFQEGVAYYRGAGSYRRAFRVPPDDVSNPKWFLESDGFYGTGDLWLNGQPVGHINGDYLGFRLDVTQFLRTDGDNILGIRLTNRCKRNVLPGIDMPDFLLYGGLSGRIRLVREAARRIDPKAVAVRCVDTGNDDVQVTISWALEGDPKADDKLKWQLIDPDGNESTPAQSIAVGNRNQGVTVFSIKQPKRWDIEAPQRYTANGQLLRDEQRMDCLTQSFGIRSAEFRPHQGFFLNGRRVPLRGCNRHESMPGFGRALPRWMHEADARLIKAMGLNFVRLSHYPQHPAFLEACDRLGILVYAELSSWKSVRGGGWLRNAKQQMEGMIRRDRHHPSIILWGMGNEGRHAGAYNTLYQLCKHLDPQRAVTYAENHTYRARRYKTLGIPDVWGLNYEFDALQEGVAASRLKCAVVSECSNYPHTKRGDTDAEHKQLETIRTDLNRIATHPEIAGFALWCLNDYATLRKQRYRRFSGIVDAWRTPKASARWLAEDGGDKQLTKTDLPTSTAEQAAQIQLHTGNGSLTPDGDGTVEIIVTVLDADGQQAAWSGELTAQATGPARIRAFDGNGTIWIADGIGRAFVSQHSSAIGPVTITVKGDNLATAVLDLECTKA